MYSDDHHKLTGNTHLFSPLQTTCDKYGSKLNTCCVKIETAMYDLLTMILPEGKEDLQAALEMDMSTADGKPSVMSMLQPVEEEEEEEELRPGDLAKQREEEEKRELLREARTLLDNYSRKTQFALVKCTRHTLETIKRRVSSPSTIQYGDQSEDRRKLDHRPAIKARLVLTIPHISLKPALEEIQAGLNTTVQNILAVHKGILIWGQVTEPESQLSQGGQSKVLSVASGVLSNPSVGPGQLSAGSEKSLTQQKSRTFFKAVSEHKEVVKLVSLMTATFSSAKALVIQSLEHFKHYEELWTVDRDNFIAEFMKDEPSLSDFEAKMKEYTAMDDVIAEEDDLMDCGAMALLTGN